MRSGNKPDIIQDLSPAESKQLLSQGTQALGITLSPRQIEQFMAYLTLLNKWNRHINLTGLKSCREIILKHFLDSLTPIPYLPEEARLLDLGSGAGFPGLPIKIVRPNQPISLIEASAKKVSFLKEAARRLELGLVPIYQNHLGKDPSPFGETDFFEIVITRAVGQIINLLIAADPFLRPEGKVLFMKGPKGPEEVFDLKAQIRERGFRIETPLFLTSPLSGQERTLIFVTKSKL